MRGFFAALAVAAFSVLTSGIAVGPLVASAHTPALPTYDGAMSFPAIHGPEDMEEFSWEVSLAEGQALKQIDEKHAGVFHEEGLPAFGIVAEPAHDAVGSGVPTSLSVSEGNVITLAVHHRTGNPAAGGAPFVYPITEGAGWEGGFHTYSAAMPPPEKVAGALPGKGCLVPKLKGRTLKGSKKRLSETDCKVGIVRKSKGITAKTGKVVKQNPKWGTVLAPGAAVNLVLGE